MENVQLQRLQQKIKPHKRLLSGQASQRRDKHDRTENVTFNQNTARTVHAPPQMQTDPAQTRQSSGRVGYDRSSQPDTEHCTGCRDLHTTGGADLRGGGEDG